MPLKSFEQKLTLWRLGNAAVPREQLAITVAHYQKGLRQTRMEQWILDNQAVATSVIGLDELLRHCKLEEPDDPYLLKDALARVTSMKRTDGERHLDFVDKFERALRDLATLGVDLNTGALESLRVIWLIDKIGVDPQTSRYLLAEAGTPPDYQKVVKSLRRQYHSINVGSLRRKEGRQAEGEQWDGEPKKDEPEGKSFENAFATKSHAQIEALLTKKGLKLVKKGKSTGPSRGNRDTNICKNCQGKGHFDTERKCPKHPDHDPNYVPPWKKNLGTNKGGGYKKAELAHCSNTRTSDFDWSQAQDFRLGRTEAQRSE
jgi:hypothetical protein